MPRNIFTPEPVAQPRRINLVEELAGELRCAHEVGQPIVNEEHFATGAVRVLVLWDRWEEVEEDDRATQIVEAYRLVEGQDFVDRIGLLDGMTFPEAYDQGLLPYQIIPHVRRDDPVTLDQCRLVMIEVGASTLFPDRIPRLRFATAQQAETCLPRLIERLPGSDQIWQITREVGQVLDTSWSVAQ